MSFVNPNNPSNKPPPSDPSILKKSKMTPVMVPLANRLIMFLILSPKSLRPCFILAKTSPCLNSFMEFAILLKKPEIPSPALEISIFLMNPLMPFSPKILPNVEVTISFIVAPNSIKKFIGPNFLILPNDGLKFLTFPVI